MSDTKSAWDTPLPRMEFADEFKCKLTATSESHTVKRVFIADGITPRQLAEVASQARTVSKQTNMRAAAKNSETEFARMCAAGVVCSIIPDAKAPREGAEARIKASVELRMIRAMELADKGQVCDDLFEDLPSTRKMLERAGVIFEDSPNE